MRQAIYCGEEYGGTVEVPEETWEECSGWLAERFSEFLVKCARFRATYGAGEFVAYLVGRGVEMVADQPVGSVDEAWWFGGVPSWAARAWTEEKKTELEESKRWRGKSKLAS